MVGYEPFGQIGIRHIGDLFKASFHTNVQRLTCHLK